MKDRIVIWGQDEKDEDILIAIRLLQDSDIIKIWTFPKKDTNTEFVDQLFREWKEGAEDLFPQPHQLIERGISEESMLPESIKTPKTDVIKIAEQEWRVRVLSFRLYQHIKQQIEQLDTRATNLSIFSKDVWEEAKDVSKSIKENTLDRNIKKRQTTELRNSLDAVFDKLKKLQNAEQEKFLGVSKGHLGDFREKIAEVITEIGKGNAGKKLFDRLIQFQNEVKGVDMTIRDRNALRLNFNEAFEALKANRQSNFGNRMNARVNGLKSAIGKMEASIKRDKDNVNYQSGRINKNNTTQLEYQLRSAKLKLIEDRIHSKEQKLHNMYLTLKDLEKKASKATAKSQKVMVADKGKKVDKKTELTATQGAETMPKETSKEGAAEKPTATDGQPVANAATSEQGQVAENTNLTEQVVESKTEEVTATENPTSKKESVVEKTEEPKPAAEVIEDVKTEVAETVNPKPEKEPVVEKVEESKPTAEVVEDAKTEVAATVNPTPEKETVVEKVEESKPIAEIVEDAKTEVAATVNPSPEKESVVEKVEAPVEVIAEAKNEEVAEKTETTASVAETINETTEQTVESEKKPEEDLIISKMTNVVDEAKGGIASVANTAASALGLGSLVNENTTVDSAAKITDGANTPAENVDENIDSVVEKLVDQTDTSQEEAAKEDE